MNVLQQVFGDRLIRKPLWLLCSPDLTLLWGKLEGKVYENNLKAIEELKAVIKHEFFLYIRKSCGIFATKGEEFKSV
jgi:hypothetical protein